MDFTPSIQFIRKSGSIFDIATLDCLVEFRKPCPAAYQEILGGQRNDGGWSPFWAKDHSALDATCYRLTQLHAAGIPPDHTSVQQALTYISHRQLPDGSWQEDRLLGDLLPPWLLPGDLAATLYLAANCGYCLTLFASHASNARRASDLVLKHLDDAGKLPSYLHTHWLSAGLWMMVGKDDAAQSTINYLESHLDEMDASQLAWMVTALGAAGLDIESGLMAGGIDCLKKLRQPDGRWVSADGPSQDPSTTLEALRAIWLCEGQDNK